MSESKTNNKSDKANNIEASSVPDVDIQSPYSSRSGSNYEKFRDDDQYEYYRVPKSQTSKTKTPPRKVEKKETRISKKVEKDVEDILENINYEHSTEIPNIILNEDDVVGKPLGLRF